MGDSFSDTEEGKRQTPLPPATKCPHGSSDDEMKSPSKKPKVDVSNLYDPGAGNEEGNEGSGAPTGKDKSGELKPKKAKKNKKHRKNKKHGKDKNKEKEKEAKENKKKSDAKTPEQKTSGDKKKKTPEPKTPEKTRLEPVRR